MKTLIIAPISPYPLVFGGAIRLYHLTKMFAQISDVTLLAYKSWSDGNESAKHLSSFCKEVIFLDLHPLNSGKKSKKYLQARSLFSTKTFQYYSHYTKEFQAAIDGLLKREQFDCVVVEFSQMGYFNLNTGSALRILDLQNIEHELLARRSQVETKFFRKFILDLEARKFKREELEICKKFDLVCVPSEREEKKLQGLLAPIKVKSLPNSIDPEYFKLRSNLPGKNEITFVGATHVDANRDGLIYFMEEIFPLVEQRVPDIHFTIVGGKPPQEILAYGNRPNVEVTGYVKDVRPYMEAAKALVVPLRAGGGTRLKILEGLSFGVPTVSTSIGTEGINVSDGEHILLGDTPQEFADKLVNLLADRDLQLRLRNNGRKVVEHEYSWQAVGRTLYTLLQESGQKLDYPALTAES
ncbi:MAG TPA: glycosyltransferase family 4 protein [Chloroflexia bacterium]|nr:glycosyltransferase family 4 protein [Chloroflexia bacterium]